MRRTSLYGLALLLTVGISDLVWASEISVVPMVIDMVSGKNLRQDIQVTNNTTDMGYIQIDTYRVENPGAAQEKKVLVTNPQELGLLVTPQKFALTPQASRTVRLAILKPALNKDNVYRLDIHPVSPILIYHSQNSSENGDPAVAIKVIVSYSALTIIRPPNIQAHITLTREGKQVVAKNTGNTAVLLMDSQQCAEPNNCQKIAGRRLYAGNTWVFNVPYAKPVNFFASYGSQNLQLASN